MWLKRLCLFFLLLALTACSGSPSSSGVSVATLSAGEGEFSNKKILWVDSYHAGYEWSDGLEAGLRSALEGSGVQLEVFRMDTKRYPERCEEAGKQAWQLIQRLQPDVVIATDDNAQRCLVVPYLKGTNLPVVFAGVNWSAKEYGYPAPNVTGMIEVELANRLVEMVAPFAKGNRIGYVSIETETEQKIAEAYQDHFFSGAMKLYWSKTQAEFQEAFLQAQEDVDILFVSNNAGAPDWDKQVMRKFMQENTRIPTISVNPWMAPYVLATLAKVPEEQGEWAGQTALAILKGTPVREIPLAENKKGRLILNLTIAEKLKIVLPPSLLKVAEVIQ